MSLLPSFFFGWAKIGHVRENDTCKFPRRHSHLRNNNHHISLLGHRPFRRPHTRKIHQFPAICTHIHTTRILDRSVIHAGSARTDLINMFSSLWYLVWHHHLLALTFLDPSCNP